MHRSPTGGGSISHRELEQVRDRFISAWGQMASAWGVSRTMAEVFALLFVRGEAMNTDEVMERLSISRGNASMSLRSLVEWGIVSRVHRRGERKEFFAAEQDVWAISRKVMRERLRREIMPLLTTLHEIRDSTESVHGAAAGSPATPDAPVSKDELRLHNERLDAMLELIQTIDRLGERFVGAEGKGLRLAASVLAKIV